MDVHSTPRSTMSLLPSTLDLFRLSFSLPLCRFLIPSPSIDRTSMCKILHAHSHRRHFHVHCCRRRRIAAAITTISTSFPYYPIARDNPPQFPCLACPGNCSPLIRYLTFVYLTYPPSHETFTDRQRLFVTDASRVLSLPVSFLPLFLPYSSFLSYHPEGEAKAK